MNKLDTEFEELLHIAGMTTINIRDGEIELFIKSSTNEILADVTGNNIDDVIRDALIEYYNSFQNI